MKLLYTKRSPYARKPRIIALEKEISLELIDEDLKNKSPRLLDANPLGKVPTLILDNNKTVYDSPVICQYLDSLSDKNIMIPRGGWERIEILRWEAFADDLTGMAINLYMEKIRHPGAFNTDFVALSEKNIRDAYAHIEKRLTELNHFNLAPVAVVSAIGYIHFRLPHLQVKGALFQWFEEISQRPSIDQTIPVL
ncbi:MAG: glutathione S-transferase family protein [Candidatus Omnitrophica bacterium]|nr:glutathione S-transferase family protein [Candidatus Omnitrophota bacterium]